jgi:hypothetical protein
MLAVLGCGGRRQRRGMLVCFVSRQDAMRRRPFGQVAIMMACGLDAPAEGWLRVNVW